MISMWRKLPKVGMRIKVEVRGTMYDDHNPMTSCEGNVVYSERVGFTVLDRDGRLQQFSHLTNVSYQTNVAWEEINDTDNVHCG